MASRWDVTVHHATATYAYGAVRDRRSGVARSWSCSGVGLIVRDASGAIVRGRALSWTLRRALNAAMRGAVRARRRELRALGVLAALALALAGCDCGPVEPTVDAGDVTVDAGELDAGDELDAGGWPRPPTPTDCVPPDAGGRCVPPDADGAP